PARLVFDLLVANRLGEAGLPDMTHEGFASARDAKRAATLAQKLMPVHFPVQVPEVFTGGNPGFHCIVGNPPWDKVRFEPQQFWVVRYPGLNGLEAEERLREIKRLRLENPVHAQNEADEQESRRLLQAYLASAY